VAETIGIVGRGRVGTALAAALAAAGERVVGPVGRGEPLPHDAGVVILAVPDAAIADAARQVQPGPLVAHCSASAPLALLGEREAFSLHPLLVVIGAGTSFAGAGCAIAANSPRALTEAERLAGMLGMRKAVVRDEDRALYHAAASLAANFLVTLEGEAERLMALAGVDRAMLAPLARAALEAWVARGAGAALTGPIVRGDEATVRRQRDAIAARAPELLPMWDALADRTRTLAAGVHAGGGAAPSSTIPA
jgi:predicted short-subunit dehydrogenase-like oxidoreductase (DUF2520 family)